MSADGGLAGPPVHLGPSGSAADAKVAASDSLFLAIWSDGITGYCARIDLSGVVLDVPAKVLSAIPAAVGWDGQSFLVLFSSPNLAAELKVQRLRPDGTAVDALPVPFVPPFVGHPVTDLSWTGSTYAFGYGASDGGDFETRLATRATGPSAKTPVSLPLRSPC